jgi:hypothetical protein
MRTAEPPTTSPDQELQDSRLAAVLLARMALAHSRGQQYPLAAELDGADPDGNPVFRGRVLDAAALASGGLLLVQQLHAELAALRGTPPALIAEGTAHIAEAQLAGRPPDTIPAEGIQLGSRWPP